MISQTMTNLTPHNQAVNRYRFSGKLHLNQALHIGSGRGDQETDALVVVDGTGKPIVPGSSLRGVVRANIERLVGNLGMGLWACGLYEPVLPAGKICIGNQSHAESLKKYRELTEKSGNGQVDAVWQEISRTGSDSVLCDVCRLFGASTFWASKIRFSDLPLDGDSYQKTIRHGVGIDRDTGTAAPSIKYDKQVVEGGVDFSFEALGENLDGNDLILLAIGFSLLAGGDLSIGGGTGRGLGGCILQDGKVEWVDFQNPKNLAGFLAMRRYASSSPLAEFIEKQIGA